MSNVGITFLLAIFRHEQETAQASVSVSATMRASWKNTNKHESLSFGRFRRYIPISERENAESIWTEANGNKKLTQVLVAFSWALLQQ